MDWVSPFLSFLCDGLKWARKHIGYATHVKSEITKLKKEIDKLDEAYTDVDDKVVIARERFQHVKKQVDGWQSRVREFKAKVDVDLQLPLNCSCTVPCPNCLTRYKLGKRVVLEHKEDVAKLINEGKDYSDGTVVDPNLPSPIETNVRSIQEEAKRLWDLEADINSKVEATKRELLLPKRQIEGWINRVSKYKREVCAIQNDFEEMEKSDHHQKLPWVQLSIKAENLLKETEKLVSEGQSFEDVADRSRPAILVEQADVFPVGQDEVYHTVLGLIKNEQVRRIGIHGMGGVGKTTLLKRINNSFRGSDFELIIFVIVSKDFTIAKIQEQIMRRCGMNDQNNTPLEMEGKIRSFLKGTRYVLLLDDVWEPLDLKSLGVPSEDNEVKSKILITSRSKGVCNTMQATEVEVDCLNQIEAWKLFRTKVGERNLASDPRIEELAEQICQYCGGLPLALEVIGMAMSEKDTLPQWSDAKNTLEKHAPGFEKNEVNLFSRLRFSYDSLKNDTMRECFCYCALFREDWEINAFDLVSCWIGERMFEKECDTIDAARDKGYAIIRDLIKANLLKEVDDGNDEFYAISAKITNEWKVVMHDVLRDMALWIKKDEFKISKRTGFGEISGKEARLGLTTFREDESTERRREELAQFVKSAPNLSTLITTAGGATLFTDDTLETMNKLLVLHVYEGYRSKLPLSIGRLRDLLCLNLSNCTLASPEVLKELKSLRLLIMDAPPFYTKSSLKGVISTLSNLQVLILRQNFLKFLRAGGVESAGVTISQLESLPCLEDLQLTISTTSFLKGLAQSPKLARCVSHLEIIDRDKTQTQSCFRLIEEVGSMDRIKSLLIDGSKMTEVVIEEEQGYKLKPNCLRNLTYLLLLRLHKLKEFRVSVEPKNSLQYMKIIRIVGCDRLRFAYLGWPLPRLEVLDVFHCEQLEEIFKIRGGSGIVFSALRFIIVRGCHTLKKICSDAFCFPSLQILEATDCEELKSLPRGVIQASKESLREIRGRQRWWDALTWDSEEDKMSLLPLFKAKR